MKSHSLLIISPSIFLDFSSRRYQKKRIEWRRVKMPPQTELCPKQKLIFHLDNFSIDRFCYSMIPMQLHRNTFESAYEQKRDESMRLQNTIADLMLSHH